MGELKQLKQRNLMQKNKIHQKHLNNLLFSCELELLHCEQTGAYDRLVMVINRWLENNKAYKNMPEYKKLLSFYKKVRFLANYSSMQEVF